MTTQFDKVYAVASQGHTVLEQGLYEESATQKYDLGHIIRLNDGREFVYAKVGGSNIATNLLCCCATNQGTWNSLVIPTALVVGQTSVVITNGGTQITAAIAASMVGGFLQLETAGPQYKIKSVSVTAATAAITVVLHDPIRVAVADTVTAAIYPNAYGAVIVSRVEADVPAVGVTPMAVTAAYYFWLQISGRASVLVDENITAVGGHQLTIGTAVPGSVENVDADAEPVVGYVLAGAVDEEYATVALLIPYAA